MMDIQASIGIHQLARIEEYLERRNEIWACYDEAFADLPIDIPLAATPDTVHARHLYTLMIDEERCGIKRDAFLQGMHGLNIGTGVHYIAVHLHPYYRENFGFKSGDFPNATWVSERTASIPLSAKMTDQDVQDVINAVRHLVTA
jgi:dTDP-4-amino-4,6-dideoxygalactose transaminase